MVAETACCAGGCQGQWGLSTEQGQEGGVGKARGLKKIGLSVSFNIKSKFLSMASKTFHWEASAYFSNPVSCTYTLPPFTATTSP